MKSDEEREILVRELFQVELELASLRRKLSISDAEDLEQWIRIVDPELNHEWVSSLASGGHNLAAKYEQTLSWKITKPLRLLKQIQLSVKHRGLRATANVVLQKTKLRLKR